MPGLIERNAKIPMTIRRRAGIVDGKPVYADFPCKGMLFDFSQADINYFGAISNGTISSGRIVLLAPVDGVVNTTCKIVIFGDENNIVAVKTIRNLKSEILGYKLAV